MILLAFPIITQGSSDKSTITLDGEGNPLILSSSVFSSPIIVVNAPNSIIENNIYEDGANIVLVTSENSIIRNNVIRNANSYSIIVEYSPNTEIYDNIIENGSADGIIAYLNDDILIQNNTIRNVVKNGIFTHGSNMTVVDNIIDSVAGTGIFMEGSQNSKVINNSLSSIEWSAIAPDSETYATSVFEGNTLDGELLTQNMIKPDDFEESGEDKMGNNLLYASPGLILATMILMLSNNKFRNIYAKE